MPQIGIHSTGVVNADSIVVDMGRDVFFLDPSAAPYTMVLNKFKKTRRKVTNPVFKHLQGRLLDETTQVNNGAGYSDSATDIVVDDASIFSVNDQFICDRTGEVFLTTAVNTGTNTVTVATRGTFSETPKAALNDDDVLRRIAPAYTEGASVGTPNVRDFTTEYNFTQIFRHPVGVTRTAEQTKHYYGDKSPMAQRRAQVGVEHALGIERAAIWGQRAVIDSTGQSPRRGTRGIVKAITASGSGATVYDAGGALYEDEFAINFLEPISEKSITDERWAFVNGRMTTIMEGWARSRSRLYEDKALSKKLGVRVMCYEGQNVKLNIIKHKLLPLKYNMIVVDPGTEKYAYLQDTVLLRNRQSPGDDKMLDEYLTEAGFDHGPQECNGVLTGATS